MFSINRYNLISGIMVLVFVTRIVPMEEEKKTSSSSAHTRQLQVDKELIEAIKAGSTDKASDLIAKGADPCCPVEEHSAIFWAISFDEKDLVSLLLHNGADPGKTDEMFCMNAVKFAIMRCKLRALEALLSKNNRACSHILEETLKEMTRSNELIDTLKAVIKSASKPLGILKIFDQKKFPLTRENLNELRSCAKQHRQEDVVQLLENMLDRDSSNQAVTTVDTSDPQLQDVTREKQSEESQMQHRPENLNDPSQLQNQEAIVRSLQNMLNHYRSTQSPAELSAPSAYKGTPEMKRREKPTIQQGQHRSLSCSDLYLQIKRDFKTHSKTWLLVLGVLLLMMVHHVTNS